MMAGGKCQDKKVKLPYQARINPVYQKDDFKKEFETTFNEKKHLAHENEAVMYNEPFQCCQMPNFIKDKQYLEGLKEELLDQIFLEKNNDLYKFQQTVDFKKISAPHIKLIRKLLHDDFLAWLTDVTGFKFTDQMDLTGSRYDYTDVLLCHDDELETRRIAFILYLVPPWSADDGGMLDLFNVDEHGQPKDVVLSLVPTWNTLVWFEVTEASHHQVSEVLSPEKCRLSVHGWFHTAPVPRPARYIEPAPILHPHKVIEGDILSKWINPIYLDPEVQARIQSKFESDSEIELQGFIKEDKFQLVKEALSDKNITWSLVGPPNKRQYDQADEDHLPDVVRECLDFLRSEEMFITLSNLTGLTLHRLVAELKTESDDEESECVVTAPEGSTAQSSSDQPAGEKSETFAEDMPEKRRKVESVDKEKKEADCSEINPLCWAEVRRWRHGCYTLLHDTDTSQNEFALDAMLFCSCKGWRQECGGYTSYITKGEDEELLSVHPAENSLALVYRDKDTLKFVKHVNCRISELNNSQSFYDFYLVYYE